VCLDDISTLPDIFSFPNSPVPLAFIEYVNGFSFSLFFFLFLIITLGSAIGMIIANEL
jgi:hypothetical protein